MAMQATPCQQPGNGQEMGVQDGGWARYKGSHMKFPQEVPGWGVQLEEEEGLPGSNLTLNSGCLATITGVCPTRSGCVSRLMWLLSSSTQNQPMRFSSSVGHQRGRP